MAHDHLREGHGAYSDRFSGTVLNPNSLFLAKLELQQLLQCLLRAPKIPCAFESDACSDASYRDNESLVIVLRQRGAIFIHVLEWDSASPSVF
jgi:hypothetical protein